MTQRQQRAALVILLAAILFTYCPSKCFIIHPQTKKAASRARLDAQTALFVEPTDVCLANLPIVLICRDLCILTVLRDKTYPLRIKATRQLLGTAKQGNVGDNHLGDFMIQWKYFADMSELGGCNWSRYDH